MFSFQGMLVRSGFLDLLFQMISTPFLKQKKGNKAFQMKRMVDESSEIMTDNSGIKLHSQTTKPMSPKTLKPQHGSKKAG